MGRFDKIWEMQQSRGPHDSLPPEQIHKCTECGGETHHPEGWNGAPDLGNCKDGCSVKGSDWNPGRVTKPFRDNYARTFGHD